MQKRTSSVAWDPAVILGWNETTLSVWHDGKAAVPLDQYSQWKYVQSLSQFQILHMKSSSSCGRKPCPNHLYLFRFYFSAYIKWQFNATEHAFSCPRADFGSFTALLLEEGVRVEKFAVFLQMQCSCICLTVVKSRDCGEWKRWERSRGMLGMLSMILPYWTPCWISRFKRFKTVSPASSWQTGQPGH